MARCCADLSPYKPQTTPPPPPRHKHTNPNGTIQDKLAAAKAITPARLRAFLPGSLTSACMRPPANKEAGELTPPQHTPWPDLSFPCSLSLFPLRPFIYMYVYIYQNRFKLEALVYGNNTEEQALALYAMCEEVRAVLARVLLSVGAIPPTTPPSSPVHHPCPACSSFPCCTDPHANTPTQINTASFFLSSFLSFFLSFLLPSFIDSSIHPFHTQVLKPTPLPPPVDAALGWRVVQLRAEEEVELRVSCENKEEPNHGIQVMSGLGRGSGDG